VLARNVGEATGDIQTSGEQDAVDLRADGSEGGANVVAAIEKGGELRVGDRLSSRPDHRPKPARTDIAPGTARAEQQHRPTDLGRSPQRRDGLRERVDDNNDTWAGLADYPCPSK
jgi:hypothetical protein